MSINTRCPSCSAEYKLKDESLNKKVRCRNCSEVFQATPIQDTNASDNNSFQTNDSEKQQNAGIFSHHIYGVKQKKIALNEKYFIRDSRNNDLLFAMRRIYLFRTLLIVVFIVFWLFFCMMGGGGLTAYLDYLGIWPKSDLWEIISVLFFMIIFVVGGFYGALFLTKKRHIEFYKSMDDSKNSQPLFEVEQDQKFWLVNQTFTMKYNGGRDEARFTKNIFTNLLRKKWHLYFKGNHFVIKEDSIILGLLRRIMPFGQFIRTNFIFINITSDLDSDNILGYFKRRFEIFDNYLLDLSNDTGYSIPRQIAICMAVLLDTGERR